MIFNNRSFLWSVLIAIGALNAVIKPIIHSVQDLGFWASLVDLFGIHPVMVAVLVLATTLIFSPKDPYTASPKDVLLAGFILSGLLIPSSTASWLFLGILGGLLALRQPLSAKQRSGAIILMVAGFREPIMTLLLQVFTSEILRLDALMTAKLLAAFKDSVVAQGNLILANEQVRLVILTSCSSLANLSFAMLFWFSISRAVTARFTRDILIAGGAVAGGMVLLNVIRLAMMASSSAQYAIIHETLGKTVFAVIMVSMVCLLTLWGIRHVKNDTTDRPVDAGAGTP